jgi:single-stranded DNA-binding protein
MAKANYISFLGQILNDPQLKMNQNSEIFQGRLVMKVVRRFVDENRRIEFSDPIIVTGNPKVAKMMTNFKKWDFCSMKGVLTTMNVTRSWFCPECEYRNQPVGMYTLITPIFMEKTMDMSHAFSTSDERDQLLETEGIKILKSHNEVSNIVHVIGTVCKMTELYDNGTSATLNFQIAVNRSYRLIEGDPDVKTDYPWVRLYGDKAREAARVLSVNSTVFIDGSIYTKMVKKKTYCEKCGYEHVINELVSEIHPYSVEYLHNCNLPADEYTEDYTNFPG